MTNEKIAKFPIKLNIIVKNNKGKVLVLKQKESPNLWEIPNGYLNEFETLSLALERITFEESGFIVKQIGNKYYGDTDFYSNINSKNDYFVEITTDAIIVTGTVKLTESHVDHRWINLDLGFELPLTFSTKQIFVKHYQDMEALNRMDEPTIRPVIVAGRALIQKENKYLMLKRAETNSYNSQWELPGGKLNVFEKMEDSIMREVFEETGLMVDVVEPVIYINSKIHDRGRRKGYTYMNFVSKVKIRSGKIKITEKHSDYKWFTKRDLLKLEMTPYTKEQITEIFLKK